MGKAMKPPTVLEEKSFTKQDLEAIKKTNPEIIDIYERQLDELFEVSQPDKVEDPGARKSFIDAMPTGDLAGSWIYYPWCNKVLHIVGEEDFFKLRTNRNRNLITESEQRLLRSKTVGVAGMSVGALIAIGCAYSGISDTVKIVDCDEVDTTNLNRLQVSALDLYSNKAELAARRIYEANPFAKVHMLDSKLDEENIDDFFNKDKKLDIIFDEVDDFKMKVSLRLKAQANKIPLVMMTSIDNRVLIDIERYDTDETTKPFLGKADEAVHRIQNSNEITQEDIKRYSIELVDKQHVSKRAFESVTEIGKTLNGRPQLFSTVNVSDGVAVFVIRKVFLDNEGLIESGRYFIDLSSVLEQA